MHVVRLAGAVRQGGNRPMRGAARAVHVRPVPGPRARQYRRRVP